MDENEKQQKRPSVRIWLCGPFRMEWVDSHTRQILPMPELDLHGRDMAPALSLLKLLLCQSGRQAHRDWIMEQFWPEGIRRTASHRLENIASVVRKSFRFPDGEPLLPAVYGKKDGNSSYCLPAYPHLWVDADAINWNIEQAARMERFGEDALPFWERAYELAKRGPFLADEPYADWAQGRRDHLMGQHRQCIHALAPLYVNRYGDAGKTEALLLLRTYWQEHQTDEDALRSLMELLGEQERYQEAEEYYQRMLTVLQEDDLERQSDPRTQDLREFLRTKQIQRERTLTKTIEVAAMSKTAYALAANQHNETSPRFSQVIKHDMIEAIQSLENDQNMNPSRRATIKGLLGLTLTTNQISLDPEPWERLSHASIKPATMNPEAFHYFQQLLECGWGLSNAGELNIAEQILTSFLPKMIQLAPHLQQAAFFTAEGMRLRGILAAHQQRLLDKLTICLQAVEYARQAQNLDILVAQLGELAVAFKYARQPANSFKTYQEALSYCQQEQISPLVRSRIYAASAATFAKNGYVKEAHSYLEHAYELFPTHLENESSIFAADNNLFMIGYYEGLLHLVLNQPLAADQAFERVLVQFSKNEMPERWRLIILNYQGLATILSRQQEKYVSCLEESISGAIALKSKKRLDESIYIFQHHMPAKWQAASGIKEITERFQLERENERDEELEI